MKQFKTLSLSFLFSFPFFLYAQEDTWDTYLARYEKGVGSTILNMDAKKIAPAREYPYLLATGVIFTKCNPDGLPEEFAFGELYQISDSVKLVVDGKTANIPVGSFTYQCQRTDYYYLKDTVGIRNMLESLYAKYFGAFTSNIMIEADPAWGAYLDFLYPNEETMECMANQKVLTGLQEAGDKLDKPRQVDHWIYFKSESDRNCFIGYCTQNKFKIEKKTFSKKNDYPYSLQISRVDEPELANITQITLQLRKEAETCKGDYDGWESVVVK